MRYTLRLEGEVSAETEQQVNEIGAAISAILGSTDYGAAQTQLEHLDSESWQTVTPFKFEVSPSH